LASDSVSEIDETHQRTIYRIRLLGVHSLTLSTPYYVIALAGIPYYAYDIWGCYIPVYPFVPNYIPRSVFLTAPVALVIRVITINMLLVYLAVRKQAAKEARWRFPESDTPGDFTGSSTINVTPRRSRNHQSDSVSRLERDVFWQGFFYLGAYYLTWPILVVSPFLLVNDFKGEGFWYVVFILTPLQGFWNAMVYVRPRIQEHIRSSRKKRRQSFAILRAANQHILPPPSQESTPKPSINNSSNTDSVSPSRSVHFPPPMQESLPIPITDSEEVGCIHESPPNFPGSIHETPPVPITDCEPGTLPA
jgi:hypothetical protein